MSGNDQKSRSVFVLDTSAFVAGYDAFSVSSSQVTVPKVQEEILRNSMIKMRFQTALESDKIRVLSPMKEFEKTTKNSANKVGDSYKLSDTDMQLLSLALELKCQGWIPKIVTDDYSIQNVAKQLGIEHVALGTFGIKRLVEWIIYCPACYKQYAADSKFKECQVCGTNLKRKPRRPKN
jgi:UPF0271 protein